MNTFFIHRLLPVLALLLVSAGLSDNAYGQYFSGTPSAVSESGKLRLTFTLLDTFDVEIAVVNASGAEVCHLAAGRVGTASAAEPLVPNMLTQSLLWDGKDDRGKALPNGSYSFRIKAGIRPDTAILAIDGPTPLSVSAGSLNWVLPSAASTPAKAWTSTDTVNVYNQYHNDIHVNRVDDIIYIQQSWAPLFEYNHPAKTLANINSKLPVAATNPNFTVSYDGQFVFSPYIRYDKNFNRLAVPAGMIRHKGIRFTDNDFSAKGSPWLNSNDILWQWWGSKRVMGLDNKYYHSLTKTANVFHLQIFDAWEDNCTVREGYQNTIGMDGGSNRMGIFHVDTKGNMYLYLFYRPQSIAAIPDPNKTGYGTILKINPQERWVKNIALPFTTQPTDATELSRGMLWNSTKLFVPRVLRCYPNVPCRMSPCCTCKGSRFDLDEYGRLYLPGGYDGNVIVMDNAGNTLLNLTGGVSMTPGDSINKMPLGVPMTVSASRKGIYIFDSFNHRIDRVGIGYADQRTVSALYSGADMATPAVKGVKFTAHPNPFKPGITFSFVSPGSAGKAMLSVYDVQGRLISRLLDRVVPSGLNHATWNAGNLQSGIYFVKLQVAGQSLTHKITLAK